MATQTKTVSIADFYIRSSWFCNADEDETITTPNTRTVRKWFRVTGISRKASISSAVLQMTLGNPSSGANTLTVAGTAAVVNSTITRNLTVTGNGEYHFDIVYQANGAFRSAGAWASDKLEITSATVTITYTMPDADTTNVRAGGIILYEADEENFVSNGLAILTPTDCEVSEAAGGSYELYLNHPMDEDGRWKLITEERIIRVPVPDFEGMTVTIPAAGLLRAKVATPLCRYPAMSQEVGQVIDARAHPADYEWSPTANYHEGNYVTDEDYIFVRHGGAEPLPAEPPTSGAVTHNGFWQRVADISENSSSEKSEYFIPGIIRTISVGETLTKLSEIYQFIYVRDSQGRAGYVYRGDVETASGSGQARTVNIPSFSTQLFRVYKIAGDDGQQTVTAYARHISYDYARNLVMDCAFYGASPMAAIGLMQSGLAMEDDREVACSITGQTLTRDWSYINPVKALLDPENGLVAGLDARLVRNNQNFYIIPQPEGIAMRMAYGVNLEGVEWSRSDENLYTRIMPYCEDDRDGATSKTVILADKFVDSPYINQHEVIRILPLCCDYSVGEERMLPNGQTVTMTIANCRTQMEADARQKFSVEHVDEEEITLDVNFLMLGDTEEYKQYRGMQRLNLYDSVKVETGKSGIAATAQVTEYVWNCLTKRYISIKLGRINSFIGKMPGYRIGTGAITIDKLSKGTVSKLKGV